MGAHADRIEAKIAEADALAAFGPWPGARAWRATLSGTYAVRRGSTLDDYRGEHIGALTPVPEGLAVWTGRFGPNAPRTQLGLVPNTPEGRRQACRMILDHEEG